MYTCMRMLDAQKHFSYEKVSPKKFKLIENNSKCDIWIQNEASHGQHFVDASQPLRSCLLITGKHHSKLWPL